MSCDSEVSFGVGSVSGVGEMFAWLCACDDAETPLTLPSKVTSLSRFRCPEDDTMSINSYHCVIRPIVTYDTAVVPARSKLAYGPDHPYQGW